MFRILSIVFSILLLAGATFAQTTGFTYQGRLTASGAPANGLYDLQFRLWDAQASGNQIGSTQSINSVQITSGVFSVTLDFGANAFSGASRFLEIGARPSGGGSFTTLSPRQQITSTPYAVRALKASSADSVPASGVPAGSGNYIQNTSSPQPGNFNITGSATIGQTISGSVVNAASQFNIGGSRVLTISGDSNLFVGVESGQNNSTGSHNSFFGSEAGRSNTSGSFNSFFGSRAGVSSPTGLFNSFFGTSAGEQTTTGSGNSFFGRSAGVSNTNGNYNSFFGINAGENNLSGAGNAFVGLVAGSRNTTGSSNSFFGAGAGLSNVGGDFNVAIGASADVIPGETFNPINATAIGASAKVSQTKATALGAEAVVLGSNATAIGANASATQANSLVLGSVKGVNGAVADTDVGIGTTAPSARLHIKANSKNILFGDAGCGPGFIGIGFESVFSGCANYVLLGGDANTYINRPPNGTIIFREANGPNQVEIRPGGVVGIATLGTGGSTQLCLNSAKAISTCSSSRRYKTDIKRFGGGLQLISRLQPVSFNWKATDQPEIGLIAEEVAKIEPRLTFKNQDGEIEGVNYPQITAVLINAIKEQQQQIDELRKELRRFQVSSRRKRKNPR